MNPIICPKCGFQNPSTMSFCSNCGQVLTSPQNAPQDLPPTMLSYQPNISTPPNVTQQQQQRQTQAPSPVFQPAVNPPSVPPPGGKSGMSKGLLFGLLGCGGLLVIGVIGLIVGGIALMPSGNPTPTPYYNANSVVSNTNTSPANTNRQVDTSDSRVLREMQALKQVGAFRQTEVKTVTAKDYFPLATQAAQATYSNNGKIVVSTTGVFPTYSAAETNFNNQINSVKSNGGTIYKSESKNGTQAASYLYKGFYFIEACAQGTCSRNNSSDLAALTSFATSLSSALQNSSKFLPTSDSGDTPAPSVEPVSTGNSKAVSVGVVNGKATNLVKPVYPAAARAVRASGTVNVQVTIDESGKVIHAAAQTGHPLLRSSAEAAARASAFTPTVLDGQAVKATGIVVYNFTAE